MEDGEEVRREGKIPLFVFITLPPCIRKTLEEYAQIENGETEWFLENLMAVSFLLPGEDFIPISDRKDLELLDNPLAQAVVLMTLKKGVKRDEVGVERIRKNILRKHDGVWNLVRCMNPLLKARCTEECECYRFRHSLPEVVKRKVDTKTGEVREAVIRIEGQELKVEGKVLVNFKRFSSYLEKRGYFLPRLSAEWLYQGIMILSEGEYVDVKGENFRDQLSEILAVTGDYFIEKFDGKNVWIRGARFVELLSSTGYSIKGTSIKNIRKEYGFEVKRTRSINYTLIPIEFIHEEDRENVVMSALQGAGDILLIEGLQAEVRRELTEEDRNDEDYILGRKVYLAPDENGIFVSFLGSDGVFQDVVELKRWVQELKEKAKKQEHEEEKEESEDEILSF